MHLSPCFFDGEPQASTAAHRPLIAEHSPTPTLSPHAPEGTGTGFAIPEARPSDHMHDAFPASPELRGAQAAVRPPGPRIEPLADVERLHVADTAVPV
jgi:hypothetical protein